ACYVDGLGWRAELDVPGEVLMIKAGPQLLLSLWDAAHFETEVGPLARATARRPSPSRTMWPRAVRWIRSSRSPAPSAQSRSRTPRNGPGVATPGTSPIPTGSDGRSP